MEPTHIYTKTKNLNGGANPYTGTPCVVVERKRRKDKFGFTCLVRMLRPTGEYLTIAELGGDGAPYPAYQPIDYESSVEFMSYEIQSGKSESFPAVGKDKYPKDAVLVGCNEKKDLTKVV